MKETLVIVISRYPSRGSTPSDIQPASFELARRDRERALALVEIAFAPEELRDKRREIADELEQLDDAALKLRRRITALSLKRGMRQTIGNIVVVLPPPDVRRDLEKVRQLLRAVEATRASYAQELAAIDLDLAPVEEEHRRLTAQFLCQIDHHLRPADETPVPPGGRRFEAVRIPTVRHI